MGFLLQQMGGGALPTIVDQLLAAIGNPEALPQGHGLAEKIVGALLHDLIQIT